MKNIHIVPTDKPSRLTKNNLGKFIKLNGLQHQEVNENQNIYITNDEEIKEGNWFINAHTNSNYIDKRAPKASHRYAVNNNAVFSNPKKIILTTDQDLIKDGIQSIDNEFLEWFVKNPSCEEVEVKDVFKSSPIGFGNAFDYYKIIIPKEEPKFVTVNMESATGEDLGRVSYIPIPNIDYTPKQKTLEEAKQRAKNYMSLKGALEPKQEKDDSYIKEQKERRRKLFNLIDELEEKKLQEESKQETLEEFISEVTKNFGDGMSIKFTSGGIKLGAKWQQERILQFLYSEITERRPYSSLNKGYINGYTQCQKDMAKKLKQVDIICPKCKGINQYFIVENNYKCAYTDCEHIFNKQD